MYFVGVIGDDDNVYVSWDSDEKAQIDPCQPGYRVPASSVWTTDVGSSHTTLANAFYIGIAIQIFIIRIRNI